MTLFVPGACVVWLFELARVTFHLLVDAALLQNERVESLEFVLRFSTLQGIPADLQPLILF